MSARSLADRLLFRIKECRSGTVALVFLPAQHPAGARGGPRCTGMYETRNETARGTATASARRHVCRRDLLPDNRAWSASRLTADSG